MKEIRISCETAKTEPKYKTSAAGLLTACREFYQDSKNEEAFREWKRTGGGSE